MVVAYLGRSENGKKGIGEIVKMRWRQLLVWVASAFAMVACVSQPSMPPSVAVRITAKGDSIDSARKAALRTAVEQQAGVLLLSKRELVGKTLREEILNYSSGFVSDFRDVQVAQDRGTWTLTVDVWVSESKLRDALFSDRSLDNPVDGERLGAAVSSIAERRQKAKSLVAEVLRNWPANGIIISGQEGYRFDYSTKNEVSLVLPRIDLSVAPDFRNSFRETLSFIAVDGWKTAYHAALRGVDDRGLFSGFTHYFIEDAATWASIDEAFRRQAYLKVMVDSDSETLETYCFYLENTSIEQHSMYSSGHGGTIYWNEFPKIERSLFNLRMILPSDSEKRIRNIRTQIVTLRECSARR
jgi:hypothetical protein